MYRQLWIKGKEWGRMKSNEDMGESKAVMRQ